MAVAMGKELAAPINARIVGLTDGLMLRGDVVAVYERSRARRDGTGEFTVIEVHIATQAKVWQIEFFNQQLVKELIGLAVADLSGQHIVVPVRVEMFTPTNAEGIQTGPTRAYWKARRIEEGDTEGAS